MDDNELSKLGHVFPDRPSFLDCKKMKKFIEFINLGKIIAKIGTPPNHFLNNYL